MKKLFLVACEILIISLSSFAQPWYWSGTPSTVETSTNGNIEALTGHVKAYNLWATNYIKSDGNIEALNSHVKAYNLWATNLLLCNGDIQSDANIRAVNGEIKGYNLWATNLMLCNGDIQSDANIRAVNGEIKGYNLWATNLLKTSGDLQVSGKIIVGDPLPTTPAGYKLYVETGILTEKLKVANSNDPLNWSDFVFEENYQLRSIFEVEQFIKSNKHLPEIPTAEEVRKNGIDVAAMDALLLQKIEELTLYMIQQQKEIDTLKKKIKKY